MHTNRFIDVTTLVALRDLELAARTVVEGFLFGTHPSRRTGPGIEFSQYRTYQPGDDLRRVDWKLYARSDRFFIRESDIETEVTIRLVLDASASMLHEEGGLSKFDYARMLVAALAYLGTGQGDAVGLHILRDAGDPMSVQPQHGPSTLPRILHALEETSAEGVWPRWDVVRQPFAAVRQREVVIVVSDLHEKEGEIQEAVQHINTLKNEVLIVHLLGPRELDLDYGGVRTFEDLETGQTVLVDTDRAKAAYQQAVEERLDVLEDNLREQGIDYYRATIDQPLDHMLRTYLTSRQSLR